MPCICYNYFNLINFFEEYMKIKKFNCPSCNAAVTKNQVKCRYCGSPLYFEPTKNDTYIVVDQTTPKLKSELTAAKTMLEVEKTKNHLKQHYEEDDEILLTQEKVREQKLSDQKRRIISIIVSTFCSIAGVVSGVILIDKLVALAIILMALGILSFCKILYSFMRTSYNMTKSGYIYSGILCAVITVTGIVAGVYMLSLSTYPNTTLYAVIPFLLSIVSLGYFILKTVFYIKAKKKTPARW